MGTEALDAAAVTQEKIAPCAVGSGNIAPGAVCSRRRAVLRADGWSADGKVFSQSLSLPGLSAASEVIADLDCGNIPSESLADANRLWAGLLRADSAEGSISFIFAEKPESDIGVKILEVKK